MLIIVQIKFVQIKFVLIYIEISLSMYPSNNIFVNDENCPFWVNYPLKTIKHTQYITSTPAYAFKSCSSMLA